MKLKCLQIDLARQKENIGYVKSYVDFAAATGYNTLIIYLEFAVKTADTSFFDETESYSSDEMSEIVTYAESKGLDVIPAFENLGHLEKLFKYKQFENFSECEDEQTEGRGFDGNKRGSCGCISDFALREFTDKYIREVCGIFHSEFVHMGLDEPFDIADCERCKIRMEKEGKNKTDLFYDHVMHSYELVKSMNRRMMMWDDFFEYVDIVDRLPRDIVLCNWNYSFISDEPSGHWINRIKRDWFKYYDELGFEYLYCVYGHRASSLYNYESFTAYAEKYHPLGGLVTQWERADSFYLGSYPFIAYIGKNWSGEIRSKEDKLKIYSDLLGGSDQAELILSLNIPSFYGGYTNAATFCENEYFVKYLLMKTLEYAVTQLKRYKENVSGLAADVLTDIYDYCYFMLLSIQIERLSVRIFDNYETREYPPEYFFDVLDNISLGYNEIENDAKRLWVKYRNGIKSCKNDAFGRKYESARKNLLKIKYGLKNNDKVGVLYVDLMLHDGYCTVKAEIRVKYVGDSEEKLVYSGAIKPSSTGFELGGCYGFRYVVENKKIEYIIFVVFGEGALYPLNFRYTLGGEKYIAAKAEKICGKVEELDNVLANDTRFAVMGYDDGIKHFNDLKLSKSKSESKIYFKNLTEEI